MTTPKSLHDTLHSDEARAKRQARRALREKKIYAQVKDAMAEVEGEFSNRVGYLWNIGKKDGARKIEGHAGASACNFVSEVFGEFDLQGTLKCRFSGMQREAGTGGHGITEGTILVDVELKPIHGMMQRVEVPVYVKAGFLQAPGVMYSQGQPMVIAQSAIDELMREAAYGDEINVDRKHLFSPPQAKARSFPRHGSVEVDATVEVQSGPALSQRDMNPMVRKQDMGPPMPGQNQEDQKAKLRRQQNMSAVPPTGKALPIYPGRPIAGQMLRLACEITLTAGQNQTPIGCVLPEGTRVFVVAEAENDLIRVKHESGTEVLVHVSTLS